MNQLSTLIIYIYPISAIILALLALLSPILKKLPDFEWQQINKGFFYIIAAIGALQIVLSMIWISKYGVHGDFVYSGSANAAYLMLDSFSVFAVIVISLALLVSSIFSGSMRMQGMPIRLISILTLIMASCLVFLVTSVHMYLNIFLWVIIVILLGIIVLILYSADFRQMIYNGLANVAVLAFGIIALLTFISIIPSGVADKQSLVDAQSLWIYMLNAQPHKVTTALILMSVILIAAVGALPFFLSYYSEKEENNTALKTPFYMIFMVGLTLFVMRQIGFLMPPVVPELTIVVSRIPSFLMVTAKIFAVVAILSALKTIVINILIYFDIKKPLSYINMTGKNMPYALLNLAVSAVLFFVLTAFCVAVSGGQESLITIKAISGVCLFLIVFPLLTTGAIYTVMQYKYIDEPVIKIIAKTSYFLIILFPVTTGLVVVAHINRALLLANVFTPFAWLFVILAFAACAVNIYKTAFNDDDTDSGTEKKLGANWAVLAYGIIAAGLIYLLFAPLFSHAVLRSIATSIFSKL